MVQYRGVPKSGQFCNWKRPRTLPSPRGPGYSDVALSIFKNVRIAEEVNLEFRGEAFNLFNSVNFNDPNTTFTPDPRGHQYQSQFRASPGLASGEKDPAWAEADVLGRRKKYR